MKGVLIIALILFFEANAQQSVYYLNKSGNTTSLRSCNLSTGQHETELTFPANLNDFVSLTFDCQNNYFYTIANSQYGVKSNLVRINTFNWEIEDLGNIHVYGTNGALLSDNICQVEGLAYNQTENKLYATLSSVCLDYYSTSFVTLDLNFSTDFVRADLVGETQGQYDELDWMAFSYNAAFEPKIYGANVVPQSNLTSVQTTNFTGSIPGFLSTIQSYNGDKLFRGLTYASVQDSFYTLGMYQGSLWLRSFKLNPNVQNIQYNQVVAFSGMSYNQVRGISFMRESCYTDISLDLVEEQSSEQVSEVAKIEITLYPNPTDGIVNFSLNSEETIAEIAVYDSQGKKSHLASHQELIARRIDLSNLGEGVYLVRVIFQSGQEQVIRLVKN